MPQVRHVRAVRDHPQIGVREGEMVYRWRMFDGREGVEMYSATPPRRSQLTRSEYLKRMYTLQERIEDYSEEEKSPEAFIEELVLDMEEFQREEKQKLENIPKTLRNGPIGKAIRGRIADLDSNIQTMNYCTPSALAVRDIVLVIE